VSLINILLCVFSLATPENMGELVRLITEEPGEDTEEKLRYKYVP